MEEDKRAWHAGQAYWRGIRDINSASIGIELDHPAGGALVVEAPLSPEMKAGFAHFGFSEDEAETDPFEGVRRQR